MLLFLGAGASKVFGIPDTKGFMAEFDSDIGKKGIYVRLKENIPTEQFDTETLMTVLHDLSMPKEELLGSIAPHTTQFLLSQASQIEYFTEAEEVKVACREMLGQVKRRIRTKCIAQVNEHKEDIVRTYDNFFTALGHVLSIAFPAGDGSKMAYPRLKIFTTNYDTSIETYFHARQVQFADGTVTRFGEQVLDTDAYAEGTTCELIKLHGSIHFFSHDRKIRSLHAESQVDPSARTHLGEVYGSEFMVYPVESSASAEMHQSPCIQMLYLFQSRLKRENEWIFVGSKLRDFTLDSIINEVIMHKQRGEYPKALHINPEATAINGYLGQKGYSLLAQVLKPIDRCFDDEVFKLIQSYGFNLGT
jgi:hypothetical protein